jgi:hypothetical protein
LLLVNILKQFKQVAAYDACWLVGCCQHSSMIAHLVLKDQAGDDIACNATL